MTDSSHLPQPGYLSLNLDFARILLTVGSEIREGLLPAQLSRLWSMNWSSRAALHLPGRGSGPDGPYRTGGSLIVGAFRCGGERGSDLVDGEVVQRVAVSVGSSSEHVGQPGRFRECRWPGDGEVCVGEDAAAGRAMPAPRVRAVRTAAMAGIS